MPSFLSLSFFLKKLKIKNYVFHFVILLYVVQMDERTLLTKEHQLFLELYSRLQNQYCEAQYSNTH